MPVLNDTYIAPWWAKVSGHAGSLVPYFLRRPIPVDLARERWDTFDGDFIDVDRLECGASTVVVLCHGLEGSSSSQYMQSAARLFADKGMDIVAMNHRSCSGEMNRRLAMYHSGFTDDLHMVVSRLSCEYDNIMLLGYSLGGNMVARYLSDDTWAIPDAVRSGAVISVPTDLADSARVLAHWQNKIYRLGFLRTLKGKAYQKAAQYPSALSYRAIAKVSTLIGFDDTVTAPIHGFVDAWDYYEQCSSKPTLHKTRRPLLMINADDDPFLGNQCYPSDIALESKDFYFLGTKYGGHVGYMQHHSSYTFAEVAAWQFMTEHN